MILESILEAKQALVSSTLFARWVRDNPRESARVESYWAQETLELPKTATAFGRHYAMDAHAHFELTAELPFAPI